MQLYSRITKTVGDKGFFITSEERQSNIDSIIKEDPSKDWYESLYYYPQEAVDHFEKNNSIKGYNTKAYTNRLVFDFDSQDLELAKADARKLLNTLNTENISVKDSVQVFFSGGKGFHVVVHLDQFIDNETAENVCKNLGKNLATFDPVIYNINRIIRLPNTLHQKTKLYKVELASLELKNLTIEHILTNKAKLPNMQKKLFVPVQAALLIEKYGQKIEHKSAIVEVTDSATAGKVHGLKNIDFDKCPKTTPRCLFALTKGIMIPGERSRVFFRLATWYRNQGVDKEVAFASLKGVARLNARLYPGHEVISKEEIWNQHISSAYSTESLKHQKVGSSGVTADNDILKHYCDAIDEVTNKPCCLHGKTKRSRDVYKTDDMYKDYSIFAANLDKNRINTDITFIDKHMGINRGEVTLVVGSNGSGKTTFCLNLVENASDKGVYVAVFSMDMHRNQLFQKLAMKCTEYTNKEVEYYCKTNENGIGDEIRQAVADRYKNVFFFFDGTMTFDEIRNKIFELNAELGIEIGLAVIDYAGRISSDNKDPHANAKYNALKSKQVADETNVAMLVLCQIARKSGDGSVPLRTSRVAKESGDWEEAASNVITLWRPFMGLGDKDNVLRVYLAKNRMGPQLEGIVNWSGARGQIWNMTDEEYDYYESEREEEENRLYSSRYK